MSEQIYHATKFFTENLLAIEMSWTQTIMNKPFYLGLSRLDQSKTVRYEYCYVKPKYGEKAKLCYLDADSFISHIKTDDIYTDIAEDVETWFNALNYEWDRPSSK